MKSKLLPSIMTISTLAGATTALVSCNSTSRKTETTLDLDKHKLNLEVGDIEQLTATVTPAGTSVTWSSSDPAIAIVEAIVENDGTIKATVTAKSKGYAKITTTTIDKVSECGVIVTQPIVEDNYVCINADAPFTFELANGKHWTGETDCKLEYSTDGDSFTEWDGLTQITCANKKIYLRGTGITSFGGIDSATSTTFKVTPIDTVASFSWNFANGTDLRALLNYQDMSRAIMNDYCFTFLFKGNTALKSIPDGLLPFETLTKYCYYGMFQGCTGITQISENLLPATTLTENCYNSMFKDCTGLTAIPEGLLPAGKNNIGALASNCYRSMFEGCTNNDLDSLPANLLPASTLANYCYQRMFANCSTLIQLPTNLLPAVDLAEGCYSNMFNSCTSLTAIPEELLPATTLKKQCYEYMFYNCIGLVAIPEELLPAGKDGTGTLAESCYLSMFERCNNVALSSIPTNLLPATILAKDCYYHMFALCSITEIPASFLPATTLAEECYCGMFTNCYKITTLPEGILPTTNLATSCYSSMFLNCTGLTTIYENLLPATELKPSCYSTMFKGCSNLKTCVNLPATTFNGCADCYSEMFSSCTKLKIREEDSSTETQNKIFTCPDLSSFTISPVFNMFHSTGGSFSGTPHENSTYYWYE